MKRYNNDIIPQLLAKFNIQLNQNYKGWQGNCPLHFSSDSNSFHISRQYGTYKCYSRHCEEIFGSGVYGLAKGLLSKHSYGWCSPQDTDRIATHGEVIALLDSLGDAQIVTSLDVDKLNFIRRQRLKNKKIQHPILYDRADFLAEFECPSDYFLSRGFEKKTLIRFDVADCKNPSHRLNNHAIVPIFDTGYNYIIGYSARAFHRKCLLCDTYHEAGVRCPDQQQKVAFSKWKHSEGIKTNSILYNFWFAKRHIRESGKIVIVEGPGDVWRLYEAGIRYAVSIFGANLSREQLLNVQKLNPQEVILITDNDEAGEQAREKISAAFKYFDVRDVRLDNCNDLGDASKEEILELINEK